MLLYFEIIEGDRKGARFQIKPGLSIGRSRADILLRDSKVSGRHALIESRENDSLYLVDNKSSNGIKINGQRVPEILLTPGTKLQLGRTVLQVLDLDTEDIVIDAPIIETWWEALGRAAGAAKAKTKPEQRQVSAFNPLVKLKIVQGPQTGEVWTLGYGPRQVGRDSLDLKLEEPNSPELCFELLPKSAGPTFRTSHPDIVKLNGKGLREEPLNDGDVIEIYKTRIQVVLKKDD